MAEGREQACRVCGTTGGPDTHDGAAHDLQGVIDYDREQAKRGREQACEEPAPNGSGEACVKPPHPVTEQHESENYLWPVPAWPSATARQ